jgi:hypothetical protein
VGVAALEHLDAVPHALGDLAMVEAAFLDEQGGVEVAQLVRRGVVPAGRAGGALERATCPAFVLLVVPVVAAAVRDDGSSDR